MKNNKRNENYEELTLQERWEIIEDMTCNMDEEEREDFLMDWGE